MRRALNQRSKRVWLLYVGERNFATCQQRFGCKAIRASHAGNDRYRRVTQVAENITARPSACTDEKNRIPDARCSHTANRRSSLALASIPTMDCVMIERLWRVRDPLMWHSFQMHRCVRFAVRYCLAA